MRRYVLGIVSHKGGTGRTTSARALAWLWKQQGASVALCDPDAGALASEWNDIPVVADLRQVGDADVVVVDCPPLGETATQAVLARADGLVLTCLAEVMALRTLPLATRVLLDACRRKRGLEFHGVLMTRFRDDAVQTRLREEVRRLEGDLLLVPEIPEEAELRMWGVETDSPLPEGAARDAYARIADELARRLGLFADAVTS